MFSPGGPLDYLRGIARGPLHAVADFYIPFRLFQVEISNRGNIDRRIFGVDAVEGSLTPYSFENLPTANEVITDVITTSASQRTE